MRGRQTSPASIRANRRLALQRANAVRNYLRRLGVWVPITTLSVGPFDPVDVDRQYLNRRAVITLYF